MIRSRAVRAALLAALVLGIVAPVAAQTRGAELEDKYFDSDGVKIRYVEAGRGDPVVLIHGFGANLDLNWRRSGVFGTLSKDFSVVAIDCRGHGKSDKPHDAASYGSQMAADVKNLLDHLKIARAHIVGYSMGADIAAQFATLYPDRAATVTLGGSPVVRSWDAEQARDADDLALSLEEGRGLGTLIRHIWPPNERPPTDAAVEMVSRDVVSRNDPLALAAVVRGRRTRLVTDDQLKALHVPMLAIVGSADPSVRGVQALQQALPALRVVIIEGATHVGPPRGAPAQPQFTAALREFVMAYQIRSSEP